MADRLWPADNVERWPIERLIPYARNARQHSDAQIAQIAASIREWGWTIPILADEEGGIIAGHGRVLAARKLSLADVPVMVARGWTEGQTSSRWHLTGRGSSIPLADVAHLPIFRSARGEMALATGSVEFGLLKKSQPRMPEPDANAFAAVHD